MAELPHLLGIRVCSKAEAESYTKYLESSDKTLERDVAQLLRTDQAALGIGKLLSLDALGALPTFWKWIGEGESVQLAAEVVDRDRFLVREALAIMQKVHRPDHADLTTVAHLTRRDEAGEQPHILLLWDEEDPYVLDGNHGALAVYERRRWVEAARFCLVVHLLQMPPGQRLAVQSSPPR